MDRHRSKLMSFLDLCFLLLSLGCGIGYGYLHRIPTRPVLPVGSQADVSSVSDSTRDSVPTTPLQPDAHSGSSTSLPFFFKVGGINLLPASDPAAW